MLVFCATSFQVVLALRILLVRSRLILVSLRKERKLRIISAVSVAWLRRVLDHTNDMNALENSRKMKCFVIYPISDMLPLQSS